GCGRRKRSYATHNVIRSHIARATAVFGKRGRNPWTPAIIRWIPRTWTRHIIIVESWHIDRFLFGLVFNADQSILETYAAVIFDFSSTFNKLETITAIEIAVLN